MTSSEELRAQLDEIQSELSTLTPVTDEELATQVAAGDVDVDALVNNAARQEARRRVLEIQQKGLSKQLTAALRAEAVPTIAKHTKARDKAVERAREALQSAHAAVDALAVAIDQWSESAGEAEHCGLQANDVARQAGVEQPVMLPGIGSADFYKIEKRLVSILRPHRRDGSQLGKQQVEA